MGFNSVFKGLNLGFKWFDTYSWFQAFAVIWILKMFFWVFPRRHIVVDRRFGTLYRFHLQRLVVDCLIRAHLRQCRIFWKKKNFENRDRPAVVHQSSLSFFENGDHSNFLPDSKENRCYKVRLIINLRMVLKYPNKTLRYVQERHKFHQILKGVGAWYPEKIWLRDGCYRQGIRRPKISRKVAQSVVFGDALKACNQYSATSRGWVRRFPSISSCVTAMIMNAY